MKKTLIVLAAIVLVLAISVAVWRQFNPSEDNVGAPEPPTTAAPPEPAQPEWCPAVEFISAPGTWESRADDDPLAPTANELSFMLSVSRPLQESFPAEQVKVWTLPYTAQFRNINANHEMSYDESREEGRARLEEELRFMHENCPLTTFAMAGFSQGAVILGDIADDIGAGVGVIPADRVAGVALVADGRRENGVGINPGVELSGIGAEIALQPLSGLLQPIVPGATMRGARPHGFGELAPRIYQICAPNDAICDAPVNVHNGIDRALGLIQANGVHALYASNDSVIPGTTADQWLVEWAHSVVSEQLTLAS